MPEVEEYECPECGETITEGMKFCPNCEMELEWGDGTEEAVDELLTDVNDAPWLYQVAFTSAVLTLVHAGVQAIKGE